MKNKSIFTDPRIPVKRKLILQKDITIPILLTTFTLEDNYYPSIILYNIPDLSDKLSGKDYKLEVEGTVNQVGKSNGANPTFLFLLLKFIKVLVFNNNEWLSEAEKFFSTSSDHGLNIPITIGPNIHQICRSLKPAPIKDLQNMQGEALS